METGDQDEKRDEADEASMGPRLNSHGDECILANQFYHYKASMGPRLNSHGDISRWLRLSPPAVCFNGATAEQPWRHAELVEIRVEAGELQWGHG